MQTPDLTLPPKELELALLTLPDTLLAHPGIKRLMAAYDAEVERLKQSNAGFEARAVFAEDYAASLRLLVDRLRADAERYQCLRQQHEEADSGITMCVFYPINDSSLEPIGCMPGELDAAIDAVRKIRG